MTYHVGLDPKFAALISRSPYDPHITCDGCGTKHVVARHGIPYTWFLDGKAPPKWSRAHVGGRARALEYCPRCTLWAIYAHGAWKKKQAATRLKYAQRAVTAFNQLFPVGTTVRYWPGLREGEGYASTTHSEATIAGDHACVLVTGCAEPIALTHVQVTK